MEGTCSTGQSPQWAVVPVEEDDSLISQNYFGMKLYMFRTVPPSIIRRFSLYTQQWYMSYRFVVSFRAAAGSGWNFHPDPAAARNI
jgi:hypothetical protein